MLEPDGLSQGARHAVAARAVLRGPGGAQAPAQHVTGDHLGAPGELRVRTTATASTPPATSQATTAKAKADRPNLDESPNSPMKGTPAERRPAHQAKAALETPPLHDAKPMKQATAPAA